METQTTHIKNKVFYLNPSMVAGDNFQKTEVNKNENFNKNSNLCYKYDNSKKY